jgi:tetratricopeptide (TPR) repeat protein
VPLLAEGEFALVTQQLEAARKKDVRLEFGGDHDILTALADCAAQQRDLNALRKYAPLAEAANAPLGHRLYTAITHRAWGVAHTLAGEYPRAEGRLQQALEIFTSYQARWQIGRTLFEMGVLARAQGEAERARDYFTRALTAFEEMGAVPLAARTRAALEGLSAI